MNRLLLVIFLMSSLMVSGQDAQTLALKKKLQREINPGGKDVYKLNLKANQFNLVMVIQDGVDLQIKTMDQTGKELDRKSTRLNSSHSQISYAVFCLKKKKN